MSTGQAQSIERAHPDTLLLPPDNPDYQVLGIFSGLEGYLVRYDNALLRGGNVINSEGMDVLQEHDVKLIISITPSDLVANLSDVYSMKFVEMEFDHGSGLSSAVLDSFFILMESKPGGVYLHCEDGNTYAALLAMAYRIHLKRWNHDRAMIEFARLGGSLKDYHPLIEQVLAYKK